MKAIELYRPDRSFLGPEAKESRPLTKQVVVTIGGSRGIGAAQNQLLAELGASIVTIHRDARKENRFAPVLEQLKETGSPVVSMLGDVTDPSVQESMLHKALELAGERGIYALNLNAAGGATGTLEEARRLNIKMPQQVVDLFLPYMQKGGVIIYPESLWSQFWPHVALLPGYQQVAPTKHEAVQNLIQDAVRFAEREVTLRRVSGHAVSGTFMIDSLLRRRFKDAFVALEATCVGGQFPDVNDMAAATVYGLLHPEDRPGEVIYVLGKDEWGFCPDSEDMRAYVQRINEALAPFQGSN